MTRLYPYTIGALILLFAAIGLFLKSYSLGADSVQRKFDAYIVEADKQRIGAERAAQAKERQLQTNIDKLRQEKAHEARRLAADYAAALDSLRQRTPRPAPSDLPQTPSAGGASTSCTGGELYREDAEFLVREAARADQLRIDLSACYAAYRALRTD